MTTIPNRRDISLCIRPGRFTDLLLGMFIKADVDPGVGRSGELGQGLQFGEAKQCGITAVRAGGLFTRAQSDDVCVDSPSPLSFGPSSEYGPRSSVDARHERACLGPPIHVRSTCWRRHKGRSPLALLGHHQGYRQVTQGSSQSAENTKPACDSKCIARVRMQALGRLAARATDVSKVRERRYYTGRGVNSKVKLKNIHK